MIIVICPEKLKMSVCISVRYSLLHREEFEALYGAFDTVMTRSIEDIVSD